MRNITHCSNFRLNTCTAIFHVSYFFKYFFYGTKDLIMSAIFSLSADGLQNRTLRVILCMDFNVILAFTSNQQHTYIKMTKV